MSVKQIPVENMSQKVKPAKEVSIYKVLKEISGEHPLEITHQMSLLGV